MIYTLTLNPALDYVMDTEDIKTGKVNRSSAESFFIGGKGINVSIVLAEFKIESTALGFVGGFTGDMLERTLGEYGVKTDFCHLTDGITRVNVKLRGKSVTEINGAGPAISQRDLNALYEKLEHLTAGDTLVLSGSIPPSLPADTYEQILSRLDNRGIRFAVDACGALLTNTLKYKPFLIKPNLDELSEITDSPLCSEDDIAEAALKLRNMGAVNVLVTMGEHGATLFDEYGKRIHHAPFKGKAVNTVGAGDSTVAGFLAGSGHGYESALRYGCAAGAATAFSEGLAKWETIASLLQSDDR